MKNMLVFAGPNGSGKSTITSRFPVFGAYVNADEIGRKLGCDALRAAQIATATREKLLENGMSFTFETVLSTPRNVDLMQRARANGYTVTVVYVLTNDPDINVARVRARVAAGGHSVEEEKIRTRYIRAMALIPEMCGTADRVLIFDNSAERGGGGPYLIAEIKDGHAEISPCPYWSRDEIMALLAGKHYQTNR